MPTVPDGVAAICGIAATGCLRSSEGQFRQCRRCGELYRSGDGRLRNSFERTTRTKGRPEFWIDRSTVHADHAGCVLSKCFWRPIRKLRRRSLSRAWRPRTRCSLMRLAKRSVQHDPGLSQGEAILREGKFEKIAIANPSTAPYGAAAVEAMKALGVYDEHLREKLSRATTSPRPFSLSRAACRSWVLWRFLKWSERAQNQCGSFRTTSILLSDKTLYF